MSRHKYESRKRQLLIAADLILFILAFALVYFIPPTNIFLIVLFVILIASIVCISMLLFFPKKYAVIASIYTITMLVANYIAGFEIVNNLLIISLFVGVWYLVQ